VIDDRDLVGELVGLFEVLGGQQQRRPLAPKVADDGPDLVPAARVEAGGRLVEEEHPRPCEQTGGKVEPAAHPSRVGLGGAISRSRQVEALE